VASICFPCPRTFPENYRRRDGLSIENFRPR
jgi:hypothetical protein